MYVHMFEIDFRETQNVCTSTDMGCQIDNFILPVSRKVPFFGFEMPFGTFYQSALCIALSYPDNMVVIDNQAIERGQICCLYACKDFNVYSLNYDTYLPIEWFC